MILYVLKRHACTPKHIRILLSLFSKYQISCKSVTYLELKQGLKHFQKLSNLNDYQFPKTNSKFFCVYFITDFTQCQSTPREIKIKFRKKFGFSCIHASDDNLVGEIEIDNIQYPKNKILYIMSHVDREKSLKKKGYFI